MEYFLIFKQNALTLDFRFYILHKCYSQNGFFSNGLYRLVVEKAILKALFTGNKGLACQMIGFYLGQ